jgi:hypothetical protein
MRSRCALAILSAAILISSAAAVVSSKTCPARYAFPHSHPLRPLRIHPLLKDCVTGCGTSQFCDTTQDPDVCTNCPVGEFAPAFNVYTAEDTSSVTACTPCPGGKYRPAGTNQVCDVCPPGKFAAASSGLCTGCTIGKYQDERAQSSCKHCQPGSQSTAGATGPDLCLACAAGKFNPADSTTNCQTCPAGKFQRGPTATTFYDEEWNDFTRGSHCADCPVGFYGAGATTCTACPVGKSTAATASTVVGDCVWCEAGKYTAAYGTHNHFTKSSNTWTAPLGYPCTDCPKGWFGTGSALCALCPANKYSSSAGQASCESCASTFSTVGECAGPCCCLSV